MQIIYKIFFIVIYLRLKYYFISHLYFKASKILFNEWFIKLKGKQAHFKNLKQEYFTSLNIEPFERFFLIEINQDFYIRNELKELIFIISKKWSKISKYGNISFDKPKYKIITIKNSFHGRTIATLKATAQEDKHKHFGPYPDGFIYAEDINEAISLIDDSTVAIMLELIQGEGGIFMQDISQIKKLEKTLKEKKLLLIIDEIQTGVYRSGNFLISQYFKIKPDIITLAKGLATGIPIGVMMTNVKDIFTFGDHGSTFGGNHLSTTVSCKVLDILEKYSNSGTLQENIKFFDSYLLYFMNKYPNLFVQKNGHGFMQGLVLKDDTKLNELIKSSLKNGLLILKSGKNIIRFLPPLNITKKEMIKGFKRFENSIIETLK